MKNNNRNFWIAGGIIVAIIILFAVFRGPGQVPTPPNSNNSSQSGSETSTPSLPNQNTSKPDAMTDKNDSSFIIEGVLAPSNDLSRGNIMITTSDKTLYIFSSRDWSSLYNQQVKINAQGTSKQFQVLDITDK